MRLLDAADHDEPIKRAQIGVTCSPLCHGQCARTRQGPQGPGSQFMKLYIFRSPMGDVKRFDAVNLKQRAEPAGCHAARVISAQEELFCSRSTSLDNARRRALPAKKNDK